MYNSWSNRYSIKKVEILQDCMKNNRPIPILIITRFKSSLYKNKNMICVQVTYIYIYTYINLFII